MSITPAAFGYVSDLVRQGAAIVLAPGKEYLVESRLAPLARAGGFADVSAFVQRLRESPDAATKRRVVEAMTTNETSWFRDRTPFQALSEHVVPELAKVRASKRRFSVWSAACASGQEAYSISMLLRDHPLLRDRWTFDVLATDVSAQMVTRTREARYTQLEVNRGLPASLLVKHFDRVGPDWHVVDEIRRPVRARTLNLAEPFPADISGFDVVFLRNVLIYFSHGVKREVLSRVRRVLKLDGYLFLGGAETTLGLDDAFERTPFGRGVAYRLADTAGGSHGSRPDAARPDAARPDAARPDAARPDAARPDAARGNVSAMRLAGR